MFINNSMNAAGSCNPNQNFNKRIYSLRDTVSTRLDMCLPLLRTVKHKVAIRYKV